MREEEGECEHCGKGYDTFNDATACENSHIANPVAVHSAADSNVSLVVFAERDALSARSEGGSKGGDGDEDDEGGERDGRDGRDGRGYESDSTQLETKSDRGYESDSTHLETESESGRAEDVSCGETGDSSCVSEDDFEV